MRLWSLHPSLIDRRGLVALWREGLLAQAVLRGQTRGYRQHPQLARFQALRAPVSALAAYLHLVQAEAEGRGYRFDRSRLARPGRGVGGVLIPVTEGQLAFEWRHLLAKVRLRDPVWHDALVTLPGPVAHPLLQVVPGEVEHWERDPGARPPTVRR
jgi:hypothetical protein